MEGWGWESMGGWEGWEDGEMGGWEVGGGKEEHRSLAYFSVPLFPFLTLKFELAEPIESVQTPGKPLEILSNLNRFRQNPASGNKELRFSCFQGKRSLHFGCQMHPLL